MCTTEIFIDRYPDGEEVSFRQTRLCLQGRPGRPCDDNTILENTPRRIEYGEPTSEFILKQLNTPPRSSTSSGRPSLVEIIDESAHPRRRRRSGGLLMSTFGEPPRRRRSKRDRVIVIDGPQSPLSPRTPRMTPPPTPQAPTSNRWSTSRLPRTPPPFVYDADPRGRQPVIVDNRGQRRRASSLQVHFDPPSIGNRERRRSPSPTLSELRRRDEAGERERRRRRDEREATLAAELDEAFDRRRREERRARRDAEINARPPVPNPPRRRDSILKPIVQQSQRLHDLLGDMNLTARGERVIADAITERRRREDRERERELEQERDRIAQRQRDNTIRAETETEEAEARRQRLRRRFTMGRVPNRRHRVMYDDGTFRYE